LADRVDQCLRRILLADEGGSPGNRRPLTRENDAMIVAAWNA
jgi:hypothetical protein